MEFIDLKAISLLKVAEYENFTKEANELCISQPAISNHIKAVEEELGFKIFERGTSGIHLTEKGAIVIKYISQMNSIAESLKQALASDKLSATALRVGITHTVESSLVVDAIAKYLNKSTPGVSIRITSGTSKSLYKQLKNGEIDFIIMEGSYNDPDLNNVMLGTDSLVLVTSPSNHLASKNTVTLDEMKATDEIIFQAMYMAKAPQLNPFQEAKETALAKEFSVVRSQEYIFEAMPKGYTKATALKALSEKLGFSPEQVMALGDAANDLEMLEFAYHSVAMGNATDEVKSICRYETTTNDNAGVAQAIYDYVLK